MISVINPAINEGSVMAMSKTTYTQAIATIYILFSLLVQTLTQIRPDDWKSKNIRKNTRKSGDTHEDN